MILFKRIDQWVSSSRLLLVHGICFRLGRLPQRLIPQRHWNEGLEKSWAFFFGSQDAHHESKRCEPSSHSVHLHSCACTLATSQAVRCIFSSSALESMNLFEPHPATICYQSGTPGTSGTRPSRRPKAELRQWSLCPQASTKDTASGRKTCSPLSFE